MKIATYSWTTNKSITANQQMVLRIYVVGTMGKENTMTDTNETYLQRSDHLVSFLKMLIKIYLYVSFAFA